MDNIVIKNKLIELSYTFMKNNDTVNEEIILHTILSNSQISINFVTLIEDEFEIEFDDDDINIDFFTSFDTIVNIIQKSILPN